MNPPALSGGQKGRVTMGTSWHPEKARDMALRLMHINQVWLPRLLIQTQKGTTPLYVSPLPAPEFWHYLLKK